MKNFLTVIFITLVNLSYSQSTIKVMHYNLLYYGGVHYDCNSTTNNVDTKNEALKTILANNFPEIDILCVNEMDESEYYSEYLLNNVFKTDGHWWWNRAESVGDWSINQIFYNTRKFGLVKHKSIYVYPGLADFYTMYLKTQDLETTQDTTYITFIETHLKAGDTEVDAIARANAVKIIMDELETKYPVGNYMLMGDFNLYGSDEEAYTFPTTYSNVNYRFYDTVGADWYSYMYETQSTHTSTNGCAVTGGLDDRFDFILMSNSINSGTDGISYKQDSYTVFGQDGNHHNQSIIDGTNAVVTPEVANALYTMSDHLPVTIELNIDKTLGIAQELEQFEYFSCNSVIDDFLKIKINQIIDNNIKIDIFNINGQIISSHFFSGNSKNEIDMRNLADGMYFVRLTGNNIFEVKKIIKK
jgi:hypothetical protein